MDAIEKAPSRAAPTTKAASPESKPAAGGRWSDLLTFRTNLVIGIGGLVLVSGVALMAIADRSARSTTSSLTSALVREASAHAVTHTREFVGRAGPLVDSLEQLGGHGLPLDDSDR